jgi:hypothetical protein
MSIRLAEPIVVEVNSAVVENDTDGAATLASLDFLAETIRFSLRIGTLVNDELNAGQAAPTITVDVNLKTGEWSSSDDGALAVLKAALRGTMSDQDLTALGDQNTALRNALEAFAVSSGIMPGIQVPW